MLKTWDVIIAGAGPAGSMCAKILAQHQLEVLLLDRDDLPRDKPCTGIVSPDAVSIIEKEIGPFPKALCIRCDKFKNFKFKMAPGAPLLNMFESDSDDRYSVWRRNFDYWLTLKASEAGATVLDECRFMDFKAMEDGKRIEVFVKMKSPDGGVVEETYSTRYLVGADGMHSQVRRKLYPERQEISEYYCRQDYYYGTIDLAPGYYYLFRSIPGITDPIWLFYKDGFIVVGMPAYPGNKLKENRDKILNYLKQEYGFHIKKLARWEACRENMNIHMEKMKSGGLEYVLGKEGLPVLLAGEAAEMVDLLGEGIHVALESGCHAARAIALHDGGDGRELYEIYKSQCGDLTDRIRSNWLNWYKKFGRYS